MAIAVPTCRSIGARFLYPSGRVNACTPTSSALPATRFLASKPSSAFIPQTKYLRRKHDSLLRNTGYYLGTSIDWDNDMEVTYSYRSSDGRINTVPSESFESHSDTLHLRLRLRFRRPVLARLGLRPEEILAKASTRATPTCSTTSRTEPAPGADVISKYDYRYDRKGPPGTAKI